MGSLACAWHARHSALEGPPSWAGVTAYTGIELTNKRISAVSMNAKSSDPVLINLASEKDLDIRIVLLSLKYNNFSLKYKEGKCDPNPLITNVYYTLKLYETILDL